jgi:hypothetical protein
LALQDLQAEARIERAMARFDDHPDDDLPHAPEADPLSSAQSRRALPVEVH